MSERKKGGGASNLLEKLKRYFCVGIFLGPCSGSVHFGGFNTHHLPIIMSIAVRVKEEVRE